MVKVLKKWETVYFTSKKNGLDPQTLELTINHENKSYTICNGTEESLSFSGDTIAMTGLKIDALKAIVIYLKKNLKEG